MSVLPSFLTSTARRFDSFGWEEAGGGEEQQAGGPKVTGGWQVDSGLSAAMRTCEELPSK